MIGRETRVLLRHYLEQGMSKAAIARQGECPENRPSSLAAFAAAAIRFDTARPDLRPNTRSRPLNASRGRTILGDLLAGREPSSLFTV